MSSLEWFANAFVSCWYALVHDEPLFAPVASLAPKAKLVYKVVTKGVEVGDVRFRTVLDSDVISPPVEETESTHIY